MARQRHTYDDALLLSCRDAEESDG